MVSTISQREARRLRRRVYELEKLERDRRYAWSQEWPNGVDIGRVQLVADSKLIGSIITARKLGHAVVALAETDGAVHFLALTLSEKNS